MTGLEYIPRQKDTDMQMISGWIEKIAPDFVLLPDSPNLRPTPEPCLLTPLWSDNLKIDVIPSIAGAGRRADKVESLLMGLKYLQIKKVALIGGDSPAAGNLSGAEMIKKAREILGEDSTIISGSKAMIDKDERDKLKEKIKNGADIIISQPIFEFGIAQRFLEDFEAIAKGGKTRAMVSFFPIYEGEFCQKIAQSNLGFEIPNFYVQDIQRDGIEANLRLYEELISTGADIHISGGKNSFLEKFFASM